MTRMTTHRSRRLLSFVATATAAALALTACSGGSSNAGGEPGSGGTVDPDDQITLTTHWCGNDERAGLMSLTRYWGGNDDRAGRYKQPIELFEEEYPNIDVQSNFASWDDYWPARATDAAGSSLPDVFQMDLAYLTQYGGRDQLLD